MPRSTEMTIREVRTSTERIAYRTPMKFGGRVVTEVLLLDIEAEIELGDGRRAVGRGSMPLGNAWAWPSAKLLGEQTLAAMLEAGKRIAAAASRYKQAGHPLDLCQALSHEYPRHADDAVHQLALAEPMPVLAQYVAASPLEAALFDAYGRALGRNSYNLLGKDFVPHDLSTYLGPEFKGEYLDRYTLREPKPSMPLYHLVGALDPLTTAEVADPVNDGLPETLGEWIIADGLTHLKIKLAGDDLAWDVARVAAVEAAAAEAQDHRGCSEWNYSLDFNERCASVDYVLEFLQRLMERAPAALRRVQYVEQPTHRDLAAHPENRMHAAAEIRPVVIDESLIGLDSLLLARELGYTGVALKACKGQSGALLMGAAAQKFKLFLCVQDLTCPGYSFLHSASLAARLPTVAAIEGNGRQYCPAGNRGWRERFRGMFEIHDGTVQTGLLTGVGLGFSMA